MTIRRNIFQMCIGQTLPRAIKALYLVTLNIISPKLVFLALAGTSPLALGSPENQSQKTIVIVGDSITEGYGVSKEKAFPSLIEERIRTNHQQWKVINSGIGGSTSASAPARAKWVLKMNPSVVIIFLGGNDALRGIPTAELKKNLKQALQNLKSQSVTSTPITIRLVEMWAPPNMGEKYTKEFRSVYRELAKEESVTLIPFPMKDVAGKKELNQSDGIHPNEKGHKIMADFFYQQLKDLL